LVTEEQPTFLRPARALLGWLSDQQALRVLASGHDNVRATPEQDALLMAARASVAARPAGLDQADTVRPLAMELADHEAKLRSASPKMFEEGWALRLIDISRVCALQPAVHCGPGREPVDTLDADDLVGLAHLTVPVSSPVPLRASFDEARNAWVIVSSNRNLRLIGRFTAPVPGSPLGGASQDTSGFGFVVTEVPSYLQVAQFQGRLVLRDGYHRALGLLAAGIRVVPGFVCTVTAIEQLTVAGALPQDAFMGARPPVLADYLAEDVAADVQLPVSQKMVLIQGMEIDFLS
jgi:hypothetical protein